jgi:rubredoxin
MKIRYKCRVCGYVYDPDAGDPESNIPPDTSFDDLPEDYECPLCSAGKEAFEEYEYY